MSVKMSVNRSSEVELSSLRLSLDFRKANASEKDSNKVLLCILLQIAYWGGCLIQRPLSLTMHNL